MDNTLKQAVKRRWIRHRHRADMMDIEAPELSIFEEKVEQCFLNGGLCEYCGKEMKITQPPPYRDVFSFDHMLPLACGGTNNKENICVCCFSCNIIKGTMHSETFVTLVDVIKKHSPGLMEKMFSEMHEGRFSNKLQRERDIENFL